MDNQRVILFFVLSFVLLLMWQAWQEDYGTSPGEPASSRTASQEQAPAADVPQAPAAAGANNTPADARVPSPKEDLLEKGRRIRVVTDLLDVEIDTHGGDLRRADLLAYPVSTAQPDVPFRLMEDGRQRVFVAQSGLLSPQGAPDHHAIYKAAQAEYRLAEGADELRVPLVWESGNGLRVTKTYIFHRDRYVVDVEHRVENGTGQPWQGMQYRQFQRTEPTDAEKSAFIYTYTGGVIYSPEEKYEKISFDDMREADLSRDIKGGWGAMIQHYFVGAWIPDQEEQNHYYSKAPQGRPFVLGLVSPRAEVAPGATTLFHSRIYVGPKEQKRLKAVAEGLDLTVDYGVLTFIAKPIFWLMGYIHGVVHNWGWSIVLLTLLIKLMFYKLSETSYRSMANMRRLQPKIAALRERYGDDRQRMSQAMMELYKKEKINPLGGCLPMLVQIPVFIALYWVLLESVELRQAEFIFWIKDLSTKDPYYILPLLMGATMFVQQKLNPPPPDPVQAKVLMALPFIFTLFFAFFPSGLVLYWVTNSALSILQQWYITRRIEKAAAAAKG
ncbi:MAG TPA: membrane protein insertase YidC [Gammaproteobacteria bacterium]|nr:membrane protein insertase YidC [Gammaproteobacteria bacterium]